MAHALVYTNTKDVSTKTDLNGSDQLVIELDDGNKFALRLAQSVDGKKVGVKITHHTNGVGGAWHEEMVVLPVVGNAVIISSALVFNEVS